MSNTISDYKAAWRQAEEMAEKELDYLFSKYMNNDYDFLNTDFKYQKPIDIFMTSNEQQLEKDEPCPLDNEDNCSEDDEQQELVAQQSNKGTSTTKEDFVVNQEIKRELIKEIPYKDEILYIYRIQYQNGDIYEGELLNDLKDGSGTYYYENGEKYDGIFSEDVIHGYGKYFFIGGHKYDGEWVQGEKSGFGILEFNTGDRYIGLFKNDAFDGEGTFEYQNGDVFKGRWQKGKRNGHGELRSKDRRLIIGDWVDDELQPF